MTEMQKEMQKLISKDELDKAFDARFPKEMQVKLHNAKVAIADRKSTRLNSSHIEESRMPSSA